MQLEDWHRAVFMLRQFLFLYHSTQSQRSKSPEHLGINLTIIEGKGGEHVSKSRL